MCSPALKPVRRGKFRCIAHNTWITNLIIIDGFYKADDNIKIWTLCVDKLRLGSKALLLLYEITLTSTWTNFFWIFISIAVDPKIRHTLTIATKITLWYDIILRWICVWKFWLWRIAFRSIQRALGGKFRQWHTSLSNLLLY